MYALRDRHPPSELFNDEGGCASFSFSTNEKPGGLRYSLIPNYSFYFRSVRQTNSFAVAVPQRRGNTIFGRFLLPRLKGPSSPYGVIRRRRGMRKFFVLHERKTWRATLKSDSELQFLFPFCSSNRFVCAHGSAKARFPPINGWIFVCTPSGTVIPLRSKATKGDAQVFRSPRTKNVLHERKTWRATLKSDSELQFLFPFCSSNQFACARGSAKARYPPINGWIFVCTPSGTVIPLRSHSTTEGDAQVFRSPRTKNLATRITAGF